MDDFLIRISFLTVITISLFFVLRKGVYPHEYMDDWKIFIQASLLEQEDFYSH